VIAVDHWEGSPEHLADPELAPVLPQLYDAFLRGCWDYRDRIIPLRAKSVEGLQRVAQVRLVPDLIYIDADHQFESVCADLTAALDLFPSATVVGDDWNWESVRKAVEKVCGERRISCEVLQTAWRILPTH
jgi:Methyltransferase domain